MPENSGRTECANCHRDPTTSDKLKHGRKALVMIPKDIEVTNPMLKTVHKWIGSLLCQPCLDQMVKKDMKSPFLRSASA